MKKFIQLIFFVSLVSIQGCSNMWNYEYNLAEKNYDGGNLAIHDEDALLFYITQDKIKLKPILNEQGERIGETVTESWMADSYQTLNRMRVEVLRGGKNKKDEIVFKEPAQTGNWWQSSDLKNIYISTYWLDFVLNRTIPESERILKARHYKIFKSIDSGKSFKQLENWPKYRQVTQVMFDDTGTYGYAIGGQKTIWRTADGGETWVQIQPPKIIKNTLRTMTFDQKSDLIFDAYYFDKISKDFYISDLININGDYTSVVYKFPWSLDPKENDINKYEPLMNIKGLNITDINIKNNQLYMLAMEYDFKKQNYDSLESKTYFLRAENNQVVQKNKIGEGLQLGYMAIGQGNVLYCSGFQNNDSYPFQSDVAAVSRDNGNSWQTESEGYLIQASTFDPSQNKVYMLKGGQVSSRIIK